MNFPPEFLESIRAGISLRELCGSRVKLKRQGSEYVGLSPFNQEKTPSFFVSEKKRRWFDFSAGRNGDCFSWMMEVERLTFPEAVERLAAQAGVPMPVDDPEVVAREARKRDLIDVLSVSLAFYQERLTGEPRRYLESRGIGAKEIDRFQLGFAPDSRSALKSHLADKGVSRETMIASGMVIEPEDKGVTYDRFRGRIMFPIHDTSGRVIAFGGRGDKPKYLNSPEGETFHKGQILYNGHRARPMLAEDASLVVVEGYTAAIAADRAGLAAVATMGTAITEAHLHTLWKWTPVPTICFDGDGAGRRARYRVARMALPVLKPGYSLRFVGLPDAMDPDDVVRRQGPEALGSLVGRAEPLAAVLWRSMVEGRSTASPEARAGLNTEIKEFFGQIQDRTLREQYLRDMRDRLNGLGSRPKVIRSNGFSFHSASPGALRLVHGVEGQVITLSEAMTLAAMVAAPDAALEYADSPEAASLSPETRQAVGQIVAILSDVPEVQGEELLAALRASPVGFMLDQAYSRIHSAGVMTLEPGTGAPAAKAILKRH